MTSRINDIFYFPELPKALVATSSWHDSKLLIIGVFSEENNSLATSFGAEGRFANPLSCTLPSGFYIHDLPGKRAIVAVMRGTAPAVEEACVYRFTDDTSPLIESTYIFEDYWHSATNLNFKPKFQVREIVSLAGQKVGPESRGQILEIDPTAEGVFYKVDFNGRFKEVHELALIRSYAAASEPTDWLLDEPSSNIDIAASLTYMKLTNSLTDTLYSYSASKTIYRAYQYKPALKLLTNDLNRILIADEVGLGKTIEAGIIWNELEFRNELKNVLIIVPANLRDKWELEMSRRFDRKVQKLEKRDFDRYIQELEDGYDAELTGIASLQSLRSYDKLNRLVEISPKFGLVIIDEAHHLRNASALSYEVGTVFANLAETAVLLSATPVNIGDRDLFNVLNMLNDSDFPTYETFRDQLEPNTILNRCASALLQFPPQNGSDLVAELNQLAALPYGQGIMEHHSFTALVEILNNLEQSDYGKIAEARRILSELSVLSSIFTRTRKVEVPQSKAIREPITVSISWTKVERKFYENLRATLYNEAIAKGFVVSWALQMPLRQATSCLPASLEIQSDRRGFALNDIQDFDFDIDAFSSESTNAKDFHVLGSPNLENAALELANTHGLDSKYDALIETLEKVRRDISNTTALPPVLLFSFFTKTLEYLLRRLESDGYSVRLMYGKTKMNERTKLIQDFRNGKFDILLVSEVGSEGLDFEFCNVLINYDLPWNPMKVEQRIGRLDRFGQTNERIFIFNLTIADTIEGDILSRLYDRIDIFRNTVGDLEPIILNQMQNLATMTLNPNCTPEELDREVERLAVALEEQANTLQNLEDNRGLLLGLDTASISGWINDDDTPTRGRYIGQTELLNLMEYALPLFRSAIVPLPGTPPEQLQFRIRGTHALVSELYLRTDIRGGTSLGLQELKRLCEDHEWINVTLSSDYASKYDAELLSVRHPLVRVVLSKLNEKLRRTRFGAGSLSSIPQGEQYLVHLFLMSATGTRPKIELWPFAINIATGEANTEVGQELLRALAERGIGRWTGKYPDMTSLQKALERSTLESRAKYGHEFQLLANDNSSIVQRKLQTLSRTSDRRIESIMQRNEHVTNKSINTMNETYIRRIREDLAQKIAVLKAQETMALTLEPMALILVSGS